MINKDAIDITYPQLLVIFNRASATMSSIRRPLTTDDSDNDFKPVSHKKSVYKQRRSRESHTTQGVTLNGSGGGGETVQNTTNNSDAKINQDFHHVRLPFLMNRHVML